MHRVLRGVNVLCGAVVVLLSLFLWSEFSDLFSKTQVSLLLALVSLLEVQYVPSIACRIREPLRTMCATGLLGLLFGAALMAGGTLVLSHVRPTWMNFEDTIPAAIAGLGFGAIIGVPFGIVGKRRHLQQN